MPTLEPPTEGLTKSGGRRPRRPGRGPLAAAARVAPRHRPEIDHRQSRGAPQALGQQLVHRQRARGDAGADVGHVEHLEEALERAVLAPGAVGDREQHLGRRGEQVAQGRRRRQAERGERRQAAVERRLGGRGAHPAAVLRDAQRDDLVAGLGAAPAPRCAPRRSTLRARRCGRRTPLRLGTSLSLPGPRRARFVDLRQRAQAAQRLRPTAPGRAAAPPSRAPRRRGARGGSRRC